MKNGGSLKNSIFRGGGCVCVCVWEGGFTKNQYKRGNYLKRGLGSL